MIFFKTTFELNRDFNKIDFEKFLNYFFTEESDELAENFDKSLNFDEKEASLSKKFDFKLEELTKHIDIQYVHQRLKEPLSAEYFISVLRKYIHNFESQITQFVDLGFPTEFEKVVEIGSPRFSEESKSNY